jgi:hypothetical protein
MTRLVGGRLLSAAGAYGRYVGAREPGEFRRACDTGAGWYDGLCDFVFEGCADTRGLDHASQSNLVDLLREHILFQTGWRS